MKKENNNEIRKFLVNPASEKLTKVALMETSEVFAFMQTHLEGLNEEEVEEKRDEFGLNEITKKKKDNWIKRLVRSFINPFSLILLTLAIVSLFTDVILVEGNDKNPVTFIIILVLVMLSSFLKFFQETKSGNEAKKIAEMIRTTTCVERFRNVRREVPLKDVVVGDIINLSAGDMIPCDLRVIQSKDLFISQSSLTGESEPVEKTFDKIDTNKKSITDYSNIAFMGSNVISGSAKAIAINIGDETLFGSLAKTLNNKPPKTSFEKGISSVSWVLICFMLVMVPIVFVVNGLTKHDWLSALLFSISIAVGLTPEMLPMIVTTCLAKGSVTMSKNKVIVKSINSIQDLGSIDILCTDKTGTLTEDKVVLEYHMDIIGKEDSRVLKHAFLNSYYQTGLKNLIDLAIIDKENLEFGDAQKYEAFLSRYLKVDEIPFDFERRRMSVVVKDETGKTQMITKGAIEEVLKISSFVEYKGEVLPLTRELKKIALKKADELNAKGMRVIAVAQKSNVPVEGVFGVQDESEMVLIGYLAFLDPPKASVKDAIQGLLSYGVNVKILTGDNEKVTNFICEQVGIHVENTLVGEEVSSLDDSNLKEAVEKTTVFAKLSPLEKARVVSALRENGHQVGYMGDGINDIAAMKAADVGISVDTAVDIAKESADIILLEKDLNVLETGIIEGRKTYTNMIKYIKMTASSNFGNMFSVLVASAFLPFLPMLPIHILLLNLIYDISCVAIPWDNVDVEYLKKPRKWDASSISKFMLCIGPVSSIFDVATYLIMFFVICPILTNGSYASLNDSTSMLLFASAFQTGWFIESIWSQTLVIHMLRTDKLPIIKSNASIKLYVLTLTGILIATIIPFTGIGKLLDFTPLPSIFFAYLAGIIVVYMLVITIAKGLFIKVLKKLL